MLNSFFECAFVKNERLSLYNDLVKQFFIHILHYSIGSLQAQIKKNASIPSIYPVTQLFSPKRPYQRPSKTKLIPATILPFFSADANITNISHSKNRENSSPNKWRNRFFPVESSPLASLKIRINKRTYI